MPTGARQGTNDPSTDRDLILACRSGDARAWERLVARYERLVYSIPLSYRLSADEAADVTQLTFTILVHSLDRLDDDSNLAAWLATVARRHTWRVAERSRREIREGLDTEAEEILAALGHHAPDEIARWELLEWLLSSLARVSPRCRDLIVMLYLDPTEPAYRDVSRRLGMPIGSIGPTRGRCLEALRGIMSTQDEATYQAARPGASVSDSTDHSRRRRER